MFALAALLIATATMAQHKHFADFPKNGFWVVTTQDNKTTVRLYDLQQHLLFEEQSAKRLNLRKKKVRQALEKSLEAALLRPQTVNGVRAGGPDSLEAQRQ